MLASSWAVRHYLHYDQEIHIPFGRAICPENREGPFRRACSRAEGRAETDARVAGGNSPRDTGCRVAASGECLSPKGARLLTTLASS